MEISLDINSPNNHVKIFSISEILLQSPMLNMIIVDVKINHNDVNSLERRSFSKFIYVYVLVMSISIYCLHVKHYNCIL